ncbi:MAG: glycosyltransferase family 39 protein [Proteobacteria bacterium]|nr:glycosyltransferase family 39 protein [Pseudomonadota bacterium]
MSDEIVGARQREELPAPALGHSAQYLIGVWRTLARRDDAIVLIIALALLVSVPQALFHGYHYVEGLTVTVAQSALDDGNWLNQHMYNLPWLERPMLLSWMIAVLSMPLGYVEPFIARLPVVLSLVAGILLVWRALRPVASREAALFGAGLFLACPLVMRYYVTSVADLPLAVLLFAAFMMWFNSYTARQLTLGRWSTIGAVLAIAALLKGPQPAAYFFLGVLVFIVLTSDWRQLPGLFLAGCVAIVPTALWYVHVFSADAQNVWMRYTRLSPSGVTWPHPFGNAVDFFFECFPAAVLAAALSLANLKAAERKLPSRFLLALSCYALACTSVLLIWPAEINPRYVLPMVLPLCVLGGISFDVLSRQAPTFVAAISVIVFGLLGYATYHSMHDIFLKPAYISSKIEGAKISALVHEAPAPLYRTDWSVGLNELPYARVRVMTIPLSQIAAITGPAWIVVPVTDAHVIIERKRGQIKSVRAFSQFDLLRLN